MKIITKFFINIYYRSSVGGHIGNWTRHIFKTDLLHCTGSYLVAQKFFYLLFIFAVLFSLIFCLKVCDSEIVIVFFYKLQLFGVQNYFFSQTVKSKFNMAANTDLVVRPHWIAQAKFVPRPSKRGVKS